MHYKYIYSLVLIECLSVIFVLSFVRFSHFIWYQNWTKISIKMLFDIVVVNMFLFFLFIIHLLHICNVGLYIENNYPFNKKCIISRFIYLSSAHIAWGDISIVHCTYFLGWHIYRPLRILPVILSFFLSLL
jgi:hypothetical protein